MRVAYHTPKRQFFILPDRFHPVQFQTSPEPLPPDTALPAIRNSRTNSASMNQSFADFISLACISLLYKCAQDKAQRKST